MDIEIKSAVVELQGQQCLRLRGAAGVRIGCRSGTLWVTQESVLRDDFLYPGAVLVLETTGVTLVQAMAPATFAIESAARQKDSPLRALWLAAWAARPGFSRRT